MTEDFTDMREAVRRLRADFPRRAYSALRLPAPGVSGPTARNDTMRTYT